MSALKPALGKMLMKCPPTRRTRSELCSYGLKNDQCETPISTETLIYLIHEYDILPKAPLIPNLAEKYLEPLLQTFLPNPRKARSQPRCSRIVFGLYSVIALMNGITLRRGKRPLLALQDVDTPRQGCRGSTDYTFPAGGQRMPDLVSAFERWWIFQKSKEQR